jgi:type IV secretory pathway VirD2 relaxase
MERDLGTRLEWVAIDHYNTTHPHVHLVIRGVDEDGRTLAIPAEYVRHGIRERSQQLATQRLGYRTVQDRTRARERGIRAPHFGELDATLEKRADAERVISFEDAVPPQPAAQTLRLQLIGRLKYLEEYGLALPTVAARGISTNFTGPPAADAALERRAEERRPRRGSARQPRLPADAPQSSARASSCEAASRG